MATVHRVRATATGVAGSPYYLTQYFDNASSTAQQASDAFRTLLDGMKQCQTGGIVTRMAPEVATIDTVSGQPVGINAVTPGAPINGTQSTDFLPFQVQLGINLKTGSYTTGRQIQGHFSLPGIAEGINNVGSGPNMADVAVTAAQTALTTLATSGTVDWVVWSRKSGLIASVFTATINPRWFTLRSRLT